MVNKTILYYTANREDPMFEDKIIKTLLKNCGDLPILSVSQKPMILGYNICVGDIGFSYESEFRQILEGALAAETEYLVMAESDFLYPPEYFAFNPSGGNVYRYDNIWMAFVNSPFFYRLKYSNGASVCRRDHVIDVLKNKRSYDRMKFEYFSGGIPCISFKTGQGMTRRNRYMEGKDNQAKELPHWGTRQNIGRMYLW